MVLKIKKWIQMSDSIQIWYLDLANAYKLIYFDRNINGNKDGKKKKNEGNIWVLWIPSEQQLHEFLITQKNIQYRKGNWFVIDATYQFHLEFFFRQNDVH